MKEIYARRRPVIITGVDFGECTNRWKDLDYLKEKLGEKKVSVHALNETEMDFIHRNFKFEVMPANQFLDYVFAPPAGTSKRYYFRSIGDNPRKEVSNFSKSFAEIDDDFKLPSFAKDMIEKRFFSSALRISSKKCRLWTHYDMMDNFLCQVVGSKRIVLWHPNQVANLYVKGSTSKVVLNEALSYDAKRFPRFARALDARIEFDLMPGEVLFIPAMWFHNVITKDPAIALNIFWKHLPDSQYASHDLYGNKDLKHAQEAFNLEEQIEKQLSTLPKQYREFYTHTVISKLRESLLQG